MFRRTEVARVVFALAAAKFAVHAGRAQQPDASIDPSHNCANAIYLNANIHTMNAERPRAEALAIEGDRILAIGSRAEILKYRCPDTTIIDLNGRTVLPGLIDAHGHMGGLGSFGLGRLDLSQARSLDDVVAAVAARVRDAKPGEWILGGRWDHESWPDRRLPTHQAISEVSPKNPVWLTRVDGHAGLANAAAMRIAGVTAQTPSPPGGEVIKDAQGRPTGVFVDNATGLIESHIEASIADTRSLLLKAQEMCLAAGLTSVHDAGILPAEAAVYQQLADSGELKLRVYAMIAGRYARDYFARYGITRRPALTIRSCKLYIDGAMGSRGAWLLEPYADRATDADGRPYTGLAVADPREIRAICDDAVRQGYQVCTHAIGDRGNREVLDAYEAALSGAPPADRRFRIEHAQLLSLEDIPRFAALGVIPSMQPTHCTSDMRWVYARVGRERARGAYAWAKLLRSGARIAAGSDFPVESHNPFLGLYAAITRQNAAGEPPDGWQPEDRLTRSEALRAFTRDAAYAAFQEHDQGSLEAGKLADFIVIDRDVMTCPPRAILETKVLRTVIGGVTVFERAN